MPPAPSSPIARAAAVLLAASAALVLTACVDAGTGPTLPSGSPTPSASPTTAEPTTTAPPPAEVEPLDRSCADLIDPEAVYAFDPNYALLDSWTPDAGSPAAAAVAGGGVACRLVRESGGGTIDVSAARLSDDALRSTKNAAFASSTMVPTYGDEAYFEVEGGVGTAIVFQGPFWIVVAGQAFAEPGEPSGIIEAALAALPAP